VLCTGGVAVVRGGGRTDACERMASLSISLFLSLSLSLIHTLSLTLSLAVCIVCRLALEKQLAALLQLQRKPSAEGDDNSEYASDHEKENESGGEEEEDAGDSYSEDNEFDDDDGSGGDGGGDGGGGDGDSGGDAAGDSGRNAVDGGGSSDGGLHVSLTPGGVASSQTAFMVKRPQVPMLPALPTSGTGAAVRGVPVPRTMSEARVGAGAAGSTAATAAAYRRATNSAETREVGVGHQSASGLPRPKSMSGAMGDSVASGKQLGVQSAGLEAVYLSRVRVSPPHRAAPAPKKKDKKKKKKPASGGSSGTRLALGGVYGVTVPEGEPGSPVLTAPPPVRYRVVPRCSTMCASWCALFPRAARFTLVLRRARCGNSS
jgi:hypothetical protein